MYSLIFVNVNMGRLARRMFHEKEIIHSRRWEVRVEAGMFWKALKVRLGVKSS